MKYRLRGLVIATLLATTGAFSVSTHAAPVKDKTVEKLMQVSDIKNIVKGATQEFKPMFDAQAQSILKNALNVQDLDAQQLAAADKISALILSMSLEILEDPKFYDMLKTTFQNTFTEEEAQANIKFLASPLGQSINKKSVALMGDVMTQTQSLAEQIFQDPVKKDRFIQSINEIVQPLTTKKAN